MEVKVDDKDSINKQRTSDLEQDPEFDNVGNVREKGQDPSPGGRGRGESSDAEPEGTGGTGGTRRR